MLSPSRHGRQGGVAAHNTLQANTLHADDDLGITAYEEQQNLRKKELHAEIQRALLRSGFVEAAKLRPLFSGEVREATASATKIRKNSTRRRRTLVRDVPTEVRRSARNVDKTQTARTAGDVHRKSHTREKEEFFSWPNKKMSKNPSKGKAPLLQQPRKEGRNLYEDSDSDNSDVEVLKGGDSVGHRYGPDSGRRSEKRKRFHSDSDNEGYRSTPPRRREQRRSPAPRLQDSGYRKTERRERHDQGPDSIKVKRERSETPEAYYRESKGYSGNARKYEERRGRQFSFHSRESPTRHSPRREDRRGRTQSWKNSPEILEPVQVGSRVSDKKKEKVKKPIEVDAFGIPVGTMRDQFHKDITAFVKEMNPCVGYDKQKQRAKDRLQERIYTEYEVHGEADRVDEKYIKKCGTKALITWRHALNKAVDMGEKKPAELKDKFWDELKHIRESEESKKKSVLMGNQARNRGLRNSTKDKIRHAATVKLTLDLGREPYQTELDELVEKEIAAVVMRNDERKKKKGKGGTQSTPTASGSEVNDRLLQVEDFMERWDEKLEVWGSMITKLYDAAFGKAAPRVRNKEPNEEGTSKRVKSGSKESDDEKESEKSGSDEDSEDVDASENQDVQSDGKSPQVHKEAGKGKEIVTEKAVEVVTEKGSERSGIAKEPQGSSAEKSAEVASVQQGSKAGTSCQCPEVDHEKDVAGGDKDQLQESDAEVGQRRSTRNTTKANNDTAAQAGRTTETASQKLINEDAESGKIVIMEDSESDSDVLYVSEDGCTYDQWV